LPTLDPVGGDAPTEAYEPIRIPVIGHAITDRTEVRETFDFRPTVNMGAALVLQRRIRDEAGLSYDAAFNYIEQSMMPAEFEKFFSFISRPDIEVHRNTILDVQQTLAKEYLRDRPTQARSSSGRSRAKRTSAAGSGVKGSSSTRSRSR
jgi:hypothetical protein